MAPPLDNSVYNHLSDWTKLSNKNENLSTRKVLFEKYTRKQAIFNKWNNSGILESLKGYQKDNLALLLESQASQIINEVPITIGVSSRGLGEIINHSVSTELIPKKNLISKIKHFFISIWQKIFKKKKETPVTNFDNIALPIVRRVVAQTIALDLVSVQPLSLPTGLLFYLDSPKLEKENVYTSRVIIEKYKPKQLRFNPMDYSEDYFIPSR
jgi:hypothetical protein